jgi:UDP-N-acetylmuramoylalanine--D-glutamate ligase
LEPLRAAMHLGVRGVVLFGEARERLASALQGAVLIHTVDGPFEDAVAAGQALAHEGDIFLLSPACSSFDMFENYEARGLRFGALAGGGVA